MTIQQHASFGSSAAELNATSKLVKAWESKNARNAAKAGGISMMALSLAACGGSSTTTTTATETGSTDTATTTVTPVSASLTVGNDVVSGTTGNDTFSGARIDSIQTWTGGDTISGGAGTDTLTATITADIAPVDGAVTGVENIVITNAHTAGVTATFSTATVTGIAGATSITNMASTSALTLTRVVDLAEVTLNNTAAATTLTFADTALAGTADTFTLNVNGNTGAVNIGNSSGGGTGIETLVINATGSASKFSAANLDAAASTVTITGGADLDINAAASFPKMATFDASAATGDIDILLGADTVTGTTDAKTLTFGSGNDDLDLGDLGPAEIGVLTVAMGSGNDVVDLDDYADATMVIGGGDGTDTLTTAAVIAAANGTTITGFETFNFGANAGTQDMAAISANTFTKVVQGAATVTVTNMSSATNSIDLVGGVATAAGTYSRLIDGASDSMTVASTTANVTFSGDLSLADEETITFDSSAFDIVIPEDIVTTDLTSLILVGDNKITLGEQTNKEFSSTKIATIDATGVTGTEATTIFAINNTVAMTVTSPVSTGKFIIDLGSGADTITAGGGILDVDAGNGDDTINGAAKADILDGDGGNDTITGGEGIDTITGGAGVDTIILTETTAASDIVVLSAGGANYDVITGFTAGAGTGADDLNAADGTFGWLGDGGNDGTVALATGATVLAAKTADDNGTVFTISTNVTANTFDLFVGGNITEAAMEAAVITGLGGEAVTGLVTADHLMLIIDDGEDTAVFKYEASSANKILAADLEIMAVLDGVSDATTILAGDISFA